MSRSSITGTSQELKGTEVRKLSPREKKGQAPGHRMGGAAELNKDPCPYLLSDSSHLSDTNECIQFPFVCPRDKPVCVNTYGSYRCRTNKRCSRGYEPNEDGTACVGEWSSSHSPAAKGGCLPLGSSREAPDQGPQLLPFPGWTLLRLPLGLRERP